MATAAEGGRLALVVGGGPAPGINGVISSVTIEAINHGLEVIGFRDGFKWLVEGNPEHYHIVDRAAGTTPNQQPRVQGNAEPYRILAIEDVKSIYMRGGSIL